MAALLCPRCGSFAHKRRALGVYEYSCSLCPWADTVSVNPYPNAGPPLAPNRRVCQGPHCGRVFTIMLGRPGGVPRYCNDDCRRKAGAHTLDKGQ